jgi:diguanylate cyclase (GGDEF)-like protein/PAS domain S-box-containing protein
VLGRRIETEAMRADGSELPVELAITQVETDRSLFVGYLRDISARRQRESELAAASRSLEEAEMRFRTLLERLPSIAYRAGLGSKGEWKYVSPQIEEILGYTQAEWLSDPTFWEKRMHPDDVDEVIAEELRCAAEGRALDVEYRIYARDGRVVWLRDRASIGVSDEEGCKVVEGLMTDITERKRAEAQLLYLVDHDDLTGLLTRRGFENALDRILAEQSLRDGVAVVIIDLDHLKRVNDSLGHAAGDRVIREVAAMLRDCLRGEETLARLSGDEFGLLMPGIDEDAARARVLGLLDVVRDRGGSGTITASAGIAMAANVARVTAADLLIAADTALYEAKDAGRDRVSVFTGKNRERLELVGRVREAIEGEKLILYSQPLIDLRNGEVWAEELLVRMRGTDGEVISAAQFVPIAENFGLIKLIDRWVVSQALDLAAQGRRMTVNLSAASITDLDLIRSACGRLKRERIDPDLLVFEITETTATPAIVSLQEFAAVVERAGCHLALDDVGTGFGSLTYMRHLPFRYLKIDMEFVRGAAESPADARIVRSLTSIAHGFGMRTVAEGVEDASVLEQLKAFGVDYAQGYHLGRPAPVDFSPRPGA